MTPLNPNPTRQAKQTPVPMPKAGLYAITDGPCANLAGAVKAALEGGAAVLQYRDKTGDDARRLCEARTLATLCAQYRVPMVVNDDVELARESGADGVHLGEDDPDIDAARSALGATALIGISCYDSLHRASDAARAGADYVAFGAFFPSLTKATTRHATPALLRAAKGLGLPQVAIGGITPDNGGPLIDAGADFLAAIAGVFGAPDVRAAANRYARLFDTDPDAADRAQHH